MINQIEPTYLRYIYDGLTKGAIHPDNASALPEGLIGLYEDAFEENKSASERQKLLEQFTIWTLLKKEVSANFVAEVLGEKVEIVMNFIATYSKWFNSPESGKYQLYHERLRVFLLQKLSGKEVQVLHEQLIARLQKAIEEKTADEFEFYALQYLSSHLLAEAFANNSGVELIKFSNNIVITERQIKLSNTYNWSKKAIENSIIYYRKHSPDDFIDYHLKLIELGYKEENNALEIIKYIKDSQLELALNRIESLKALQSPEDQIRLYTLCLIELTLLESNSENWSKHYIYSILKHIEENVEENPYEIYIDEFIPSNLIFKIISYISKVGLDVSPLIKRSRLLFENLDYKNIGPLTNLHFDFLVDASIESEDCLKDICIEAARYGNFKKAHEVIKLINNSGIACKAMIEVAEQCIEQNLISSAESLLKEAVIFSEKIENDFTKCKINLLVSTGLRKINLNELSFEILEESFAYISKINSLNKKCSILIDLLEEFLLQRKQLESEKTQKLILDNIESIEKPNDKAELLSKLSIVYHKSGHLKNSEHFFDLSLKFSKMIDDEGEKSSFISKLSTVAFKQEKFNIAEDIINLALGIAKEISDYYGESSHALSEIIIELCKQGAVNKALNVAEEISNLSYKMESLSNILGSINNTNDDGKSQKIINFIINNATCFKDLYPLIGNLAAQNEFETIFSIYCKSLDAEKGIQDKSILSNILIEISRKYFTNNKKEAAYQIIIQTNDLANIIDSEMNQIDLKKETCVILAEQGAFDEAITSAKLITKYFGKNAYYYDINCLSKIALEFNNQERKDKALEVVEIGNIALKTFVNTREKCLGYIALSSILFKIEKRTKSKNLINKVIKLIKDIIDLEDKITLLLDTLSEVIAQGLDEVAIKIQLEISNEFESISDKGKKIKIFSIIYSRYLKLNLEIEFKTMLVIAENSIRLMSKKSDKFDFYFQTAWQLYKEGLKKESVKMLKKSLRFFDLTENIFWIDFRLKQITEALCNHTLFDQAVFFAEKINNLGERDSVIKMIAIEYSKENKLDTMNQLISKISSLSLIQETWFEIAQEHYSKDNSIEYCIERLMELKDLESRNYYLAGIINSITAVSAKKETILQLLNLNKIKKNDAEWLLTMYALNNLFFTNLTANNMDKYNNVLNIQWALDIKNQLPN